MLTKPWSAIYTHWVVTHRRLIISSMLIVCATIAYGIRFLEFDSTYQAYFRADNPQLIEFEKLRDMYARTDGVIVLLAPDNGNVFSPSCLTA